MDRSIFANNVKYFRKDVLDISQEELGTKVGVAQHTISDYERGRNDNPTLSVLSDLSVNF